jgi:hypothetical protein
MDGLKISRRPVFGGLEDALKGFQGPLRFEH